MQKVHRCFAKTFFWKIRKKEYEASIVCKFWISGFFFTPWTRVLFTFPSRYLFTIGQRRIFRLWGWSPNLQARKFALLFFRETKKNHTGFLPSLTRFFNLFWYFFLSFSKTAYDLWQSYPFRDAFSGFARHYYQNLGWFLFLWLLRCFSSPSFMSS